MNDEDVDETLRQMVENGEVVIERDPVTRKRTVRLTEKGLAAAAALIKEMTKGKDA